MKRILFIVNPCSGKGLIKNRLLEILNIFNESGFLPSVYITQGKLDAVRAVKELGADMDMVVCSGGDGTLSETVSGMMQLKKRPLMGYIPAGSTNDFAESLSVSSNMKTAAANLAVGNRMMIDIGHFNQDKYFVYVAGFGAFTEVSYLTPQGRKNLLGHQAYMLEGVKRLSNIKSYPMRVEADDFTMEGDFIFGMVTNTISVGGFKGLMPSDSALNDGLFEVLMIRTPKTPMDLTNIVSYLFLKEEENEYVHKFKTSYLHILAKEPMDWVLDGEFGGSHTEVFVENLTKQIEIVTGPVNKS